LLLATAELRKRRQNHAKESSITAKRLAEFLASAQAHEVVLLQRLQDVEAQDVFAQMGGIQGNQRSEPTQPTPPTTPQPGQGQSEEEEDVYADLEIYQEYS